MGNNARATVHAVVMWVGKETGGRFDGELTDGRSALRMVGFERSQHDTLEKAQGCAVVLKNYQTQLSCFTNKFEVVIKSYTMIEIGKLSSKLRTYRLLDLSSFVLVKL